MTKKFSYFYPTIFFVFTGILSNQCLATEIENNAEGVGSIQVLIHSGEHFHSEVFFNEYISCQKGSTCKVKLSPESMQKMEDYIASTGLPIFLSLDGFAVEGDPADTPSLSDCTRFYTLKTLADVQAFPTLKFKMGLGKNNCSVVK